MLSLFQLLNAIAKMSPELEAYLKKILKRVEFKKGYEILKEGKQFEYIYFIEAGLVRIFHVNKVEVTTWFLIENDIFISPASFFRQLPSDENIVALEDCICWGITRKELEEVCSLFPEFFRHRVWLTEEYYLRDLNRRKELMLESALERYTSFAEGKSAHLMYRAPANLLGSYIGVKPSTFYKARKMYLESKGKRK